MSILYAVSNLAFTLVMGMEQFVQELPPDPAVRTMFSTVVVVLNLLMLAAPLLIIAGAIQMLRLRSYFMAKLAAILSLVPCGCCFLISLPFGVWGLIVLNDPSVRGAFRSSQPSAAPDRF